MYFSWAHLDGRSAVTRARVTHLRALSLELSLEQPMPAATHACSIVRVERSTICISLFDFLCLMLTRRGNDIPLSGVQALSEDQCRPPPPPTRFRRPWATARGERGPVGVAAKILSSRTWCVAP